MNDSIEIKKSELERYVVEWNYHHNRLYVAIKVVRIFHKKGSLDRKKYKNMITLPSIDQTLPATLQQGELRDVKRVWGEIKKAVDGALKEMPKRKLEF